MAFSQSSWNKGCCGLTPLPSLPCFPAAQARFTEDVHAQRTETSLDPGRKAYNATVRSGMCDAYLAASVVCSGLVSTSKVGAMGKVGAPWFRSSRVVRRSEWSKGLPRLFALLSPFGWGKGLLAFQPSLSFNYSTQKSALFARADFD